MSSLRGRRNQRILGQAKIKPEEDFEVSKRGGEHIREMFLQGIIRNFCVKWRLGIHSSMAWNIHLIGPGLQDRRTYRIVPKGLTLNEMEAVLC